ncbi:MAG: DUF2635 domain-containing protein [Marivibrio sp.]|uniref:DUF2635 domain-containing protein n=1 Tax=Marivibrio sp. TaxID=2039719 RepID=UPI0032F08FBB
MTKEHLKPREGVKVRSEDGSRWIDPNGEALPLTRYYRLRVKDGDLVKTTPAAIAKAAKRSTEKEG